MIRSADAPKRVRLLCEGPLRMRKLAWVCVASALSMTAGERNANGQTYSYSTVDNPQADPGTTVMVGINDNGLMVGSWKIKGAPYIGTSDGHTFTAIPALSNYPQGNTATPLGITNSGSILVNEYGANGSGTYLYNNGVFTNFSIPGSLLSLPGTLPGGISGITGSGIIYGYYEIPFYSGQSICCYGFTYANGIFNTQSYPISARAQAYTTEVFGTNDNNLSVGQYSILNGGSSHHPMIFERLGNYS